MPRSFTSKDERQYEHIKESASKSGRSAKAAKRIAAATVNKRRSAEGRTEEQKERRGARRARKGGGSHGTKRSPTKRTSTRRPTTKRSPTKRPATKRRVGPSLRPNQGGDRRTVVQLRKRASQLEIAGRGRMNKAQLIAAIDRR